MDKYLTMDIGGTHIKYGIMDQKFQEETSKTVPTEKDPEKFIQQLYQIVDETKERISGIAISMGGFINPITGENTDFSVGENFTKYNLKDKLGLYTGIPVTVENDSNCAAIAEMHLGAGRNCQDCCVVTIGTGVGGAIIHNRKLLRGKSYKAGEFGFTYIGREKEKDGFSYKAVTATRGLVERVSVALNQSIDGRYIFDNLENPIIKEIYEEWIEDLAMVIGNIAVCFDPEKVILGGAVSTQARFIYDVRGKVYTVFKHLEEYTRIEACMLGNNAGKIGALIEFFNQFETVEEKSNG